MYLKAYKHETLGPHRSARWWNELDSCKHGRIHGTQAADIFWTDGQMDRPTLSRVRDKKKSRAQKSRTYARRGGTHGRLATKRLNGRGNVLKVVT